MVSSSAPIQKEILTFLKNCFCCPIVEVYGQTEATGPITCTWLFDPETGHVGPPFPTTELKLIDVPDMKYTSTD